jgi:hypothetical protein
LAAPEQSVSVESSVPPSAVLSAQKESIPPPDSALNTTTTVIPAEADDTIVVVAQRKKRKRYDGGTSSANPSGTPQGESDVRSGRKKKRKEQKEKAKSQTPDIQIYDYATAPNILDGPPVEKVVAQHTIRDARKGRGERKKGKKKGAL